MTVVRQHERRPSAKSPEYINTHMALMTRTEQRIAFARRHGVTIANTDEQPEESKSIIERFLPWFSGRRA